MAIGIGVGNPFRNMFSWASYWATLISATVENAAPTNVVLTFPSAQTSLGTTDFTIAGFTISSASWTGSVLTLVLSTAVVPSDSLVLTFIKTGTTIVVTNNCLWASFFASLTRNADLVIAAPSSEIGQGSIWGSNAGGRTFLNFRTESRIRQNGYITRINLYTGDVDTGGGVSNIYLQIWRLVGTKYDKIFQEDVRDRCVSSTDNLITLNTPALVQEGDYIGFGTIAPSGGYGLFNGTTRTGGILKIVTGSVPGDVQYDWATLGGVNAGEIYFKAWMQAPMAVTICDSILAGHQLNYSFLELDVPLPYTKIDSFGYQFNILQPTFVYQNMGIGGQTSTQLEARFTDHVVNMKPKVAFINSGCNDIYGGVITEATFLANYTSMLNLCAANNIILVVIDILPWTAGTHAQMQTRDIWNASLKTLVGTYAGAKFVNTDSLGQFHAGGDAGNLWDLIPAYDQDGVHLTIAGQAKLAEIINT